MGVENKAKEGVTEGGKPPEADKADERGVSWENRAKEYERKLKETEARIAEVSRKYDEVQARFMQSVDEREMTTPEEIEADKQVRLKEFVADPDAFIERQIQAREVAKELPAAEAWLRSQEGYNPSEDDARVAAVIREHGLNQASPMARAKTAWHLLQAERLEKELASVKGETHREEGAKNSMPDSSTRSQAAKAGPKRSDLLAKLAEAQKRGDHRASAQIIDALEDVRQ